MSSARDARPSSSKKAGLLIVSTGAVPRKQESMAAAHFENDVQGAVVGRGAGENQAGMGEKVEGWNGYKEKGKKDEWIWGSRFCRNSGNSVDDNSSGTREFVFGSCRREVCFDSVGELGRTLPFDSYVDSDNRGLEAEESRKANHLEKQKAATVVSNILSTMMHYSEKTGKFICRKRCNSIGIVPLSSSLNISLGRIKQSFVLTDPHLVDMPIVYASDAFIKLTGYSRHEVLGRNCRFLQGPDTDVEVLCQMRESIEAARACTVRILNYRKEGSSFWNLLHISPVRNASGKIAFYVGVQMDESAKNDDQGLSPEMRQLAAVGAVKVAVRGLSAGVGPSKP